MKIVILGTRGVPNHHGGFEQFAEYFSVFMASKGYEIYVYNSHNHPYKEKTFKGVNIIHCFDPENKLGTAGQFIYDFNCIMDSRKRGFDVILQLGYTSSSVWGWLLPKNAIIITNMDGLEWKRSKYSPPVQKFLKYAEKLAVRTSDYLVADSIGIQNYLNKKYDKKAEYIAYGAELYSETFDEKILENYNVCKYGYNLLIARLEPENNIETILMGVVHNGYEQPFLVIGKHETRFGNFLKDKFKDYDNIRFLGGIYNFDHLNVLRFFSNLYFHGHSVGGTNPSLLEAMASHCLVVANDNIFNKSILGNSALYFNNAAEVAKHINLRKTDHQQFIQDNLIKIDDEYNWKKINYKYEQFILNCLKRKDRK